MAEAVTVELDAQYRQLREECGLLDRSDAGQAAADGAGGGRVPAGAAHQRRRGAGAGRGLLRGAARPQGPHAVRHARPATAAPGRSGSIPSRRRWRRRRRHLETYKIGREVEIEDVTEERAILSLIGPRSAELAGAPPLPEHASATLDARRDRRASPSARAHGIDLIAAADGRAPARRPARRRRRRGRRRGGRDPPDRGRHAPLRRRDGRRHDAGRGGHRRGRRQLREGLLHRPGDGRPPPLPGQAKPPPARAAPQRPGARRRAPCARREGGRQRSAAAASPPPSARSRWRSCAARRSPAPSSP